MASGKLKIEGTITIKDGKKKKKKKKARKPRQKKDTTGYTGTGAAQTRQEFGQPYTAAAVMNAAMLRPMLQFQQPQLLQAEPKFEQPTLAPKETYYRIEDLPYIPNETSIQITKREFMEKAIPYLEEETGKRVKENIEQYKTLAEQELEQLRAQHDDRTREIEDIAVRQRRQFEEEIQQAEEKMKTMRLQGEEQMNAYQAELARRQNFFENEMEAQQASFQKQLKDLSQQATDEFKAQQLEDLSSHLSTLSMDKAMYELVNEETKQQLEEQQQIAKELERTLEVTSDTAEIDKINTMTRFALGKEIRKFISNFNEKVDTEGQERSIDDLRFLLFNLKGIPVEAIEEQQGKGRKATRYRLSQAAEMESSEPVATMEQKKPKPYKPEFLPNQEFIDQIQSEMASQEDEITKALKAQQKINKQNELQQLQESGTSLDSRLASRLTKKREEGKIEPAPSFEPMYGPEVEQARTGGILSRLFG